MPTRLEMKDVRETSIVRAGANKIDGWYLMKTEEGGAVPNETREAATTTKASNVETVSKADYDALLETVTKQSKIIEKMEFNTLVAKASADVEKRWSNIPGAPPGDLAGLVAKHRHEHADTAEKLEKILDAINEASPLAKALTGELGSSVAAPEGDDSDRVSKSRALQLVKDGKYEDEYEAAVALYKREAV